MVLSYCIPCHNRTEDLVRVLPDVLLAAAWGAPVEIVIVDYASMPEVGPQIASLLPPAATAGVSIVLQRYTGRDHYHMAHARNLTIRAASGDYVIITCADIRPTPAYFVMLRQIIRTTGAVWLVPQRLRGVLVCERQELLAAGGFDERFEFYGPEDTELEARLARRSPRSAIYPHELLSVIPTPDAIKVQGYRLPLSKREMHRRMRPILEESEAQQTLVANVGLAWGAS